MGQSLMTWLLTRCGHVGTYFPRIYAEHSVRALGKEPPSQLTELSNTNGHTAWHLFAVFGSRSMLFLPSVLPLPCTLLLRLGNNIPLPCARLCRVRLSAYISLPRARHLTLGVEPNTRHRRFFQHCRSYATPP